MIKNLVSLPTVITQLSDRVRGQLSSWLTVRWTSTSWRWTLDCKLNIPSQSVLLGWVTATFSQNISPISPLQSHGHQSPFHMRLSLWHFAWSFPQATRCYTNCRIWWHPSRIWLQQNYWEYLRRPPPHTALSHCCGTPPPLLVLSPLGGGEPSMS